ncbi:iron chaperone [Levilactobacillus yonginensis]
MIAEFEEYLGKIEDEAHQERVRTVLNWVQETFPQLEQRYAWNQPMFTDHGTFIIGFSVAKPHMAFAPEGPVMEKFADQIAAAHYNPGKKFGRIKWTQDVDYDLLKRIIAFNIADKVDCTTFWRK